MTAQQARLDYDQAWNAFKKAVNDSGTTAYNLYHAPDRDIKVNNMVLRLNDMITAIKAYETAVNGG